MLASEDKKKALTSPSSVFKHPADVVACGDLTKAEKTAILKQWELDARLLQVATEEGMSEGEHSLFTDVKKAQGKLDVDVLEEDGAGADEEPPEDEHAKDAPEEDAPLVRLRHREVSENEDENEDVVDAQG